MVAASGKAVWIGRVLSVLPCLLLIFSGVMKLMASPQVVKGFAHLGIPASMMMPLGILELSCVVIYLIPQTSIIGAILLTGFIGGAICTHWRMGEPFYAHIALGIVFWLGLYLREDRLKALIPLRRL
jgi:DoxX-like family